MQKQVTSLPIRAHQLLQTNDSYFRSEVNVPRELISVAKITVRGLRDSGNQEMGTEDSQYRGHFMLTVTYVKVAQ